MLNMIQKTLMVAVAAFSAGAIGQAQTLKVDVPFEFSAGETRMAPGVYEVTRSLAQNATVYAIRNSETRKTIGLMAQQHSARETGVKPALQFRCVAGQCDLAKIDMPGAGTSTFGATKRAAEAAGQKVAMVRIPAL